MFKLFCKHDWKLLSSCEMESIFERCVKVARENGTTNKITLPNQLCDGTRKSIIICSCNKCGKIKKFVTSL